MSSVARGAGTPVRDSVGRNEKEFFTRQQENEASAGEWKTLNLGACLTEEGGMSLGRDCVSSSCLTFGILG